MKKRLQTPAFCTAPSVLITLISLFIYNKLSTAWALVVVFTTFCIYCVAYASSYQYLQKHQRVTAHKMQLQMMITNLALAIIFFIFTRPYVNANHVGIISLYVAGGILLLMLSTSVYLQARDHGFRKIMSGIALYESLILKVSVLYIVLTGFEVYMYWATWYVWVPLALTCTMILTVNRNGIVHEWNGTEWDFTYGIPIVILFGLVSLSWQYWSIDTGLGITGKNATIACVAFIAVYLLLKGINSYSTKAISEVKKIEEIVFKENIEVNEVDLGVESSSIQ